MPTLTPTESATLYLDAFDSVALACDMNASGSVAFTSGGRNLRSDTNDRLQNKTYGPWGVPGTLVISVTGGSVSYSVSRPQGANAVPRVLAQSAIPFILGCGSGGSGAQPIMDNNGALSSFATQPKTHSGGAWVYFPANTIDGSNDPGWYWTVFSSTTAGQVYNNRYTGGDPIAAIPASPTAFSSTGPGAFSQTTAATITAASGTLPGGALGPNGGLKLAAEFGMGATAVDRIWGFYVGGTAMMGTTTSSGSPTNAGTRQHGVMRNRNSQASQVASGFASYSNSSSAGVTYYGTVNTSADSTWEISLRLGASVANSFITLDGYDLTVQYRG